MATCFHIASTWVCVLVTSAAAAQTPTVPVTLDVGGQAPSLLVERWIKGPSVARFDQRKIFVVEFFTTSSQVSLESLSHLAELAKKYGSKVTFVGIDSYEPDWSKAETLLKSVAESAPILMATDRPAPGKSRDGMTTSVWMGAAGEVELPTVFIVADGRIGWIGRPAMMDGPLANIAASYPYSWDSSSNNRNRKILKRQAEDAKDDARKYGVEFSREVDAKNWRAALRILDEYGSRGVEQARAASSMRKNLISKIGDVLWITQYLRSESEKLSEGVEALSQIGSPQSCVAAEQSLIAAEAALTGAGALARLTRLKLYLRSGDDVRFSAYARSLVDEADRDNPENLNKIAWMIAGVTDSENAKLERAHPNLRFFGYGNPTTINSGLRDRLLPVAKAAIDRAITLTKGSQGGMFDTLAWVHFRSGRRSDAAIAEQKAAAREPGNTLSRQLYDAMSTWFGGKGRF